MKSFVLQSSVSVSDKFGKCCSLYIDDNEFCRLTVLYTEAGKIFQPRLFNNRYSIWVCILDDTIIVDAQGGSIELEKKCQGKFQLVFDENTRYLKKCIVSKAAPKNKQSLADVEKLL